jgi:hypothetical protein
MNRTEPNRVANSAGGVAPDLCTRPIGVNNPSQPAGYEPYLLTEVLMNRPSIFICQIGLVANVIVRAPPSL